VSFKRLRRKIMAAHDCRKAIQSIRELEYQLPSARSRFAVPFVFKGKRIFRSIRPSQTPLEIEGLYERVLELSPKRLLEIGTNRGGTLYLWIQAAAEDAKIVSVDLPEGQFGGGYIVNRVPFYESFARPNQELKLLRADSHLVETRDIVLDSFDQEQIDFLFIDGDHTYEGVKDDFSLYSPLVRPGGLVVFHDILPNPNDTHIQVAPFWDQIKEQFDIEELIWTNNKGLKIGIGLLWVPNEGLNSGSLAGGYG